MRKAVRAIVVSSGQILVMHRNKFGKEYDTLPGGGVEAAESLSDALLREIYEETTIGIDNPRLVFIEHAGDMYGDQYIFVCDYLGGEPQLHSQSTEAKINSGGKNLYQPGWVSLADLPQKPFVSKQLKERILAALKDGWPTIPQEF